MAFDPVYHKGNILFISSARGFNHPQIMMEITE